MRHTCGDAIAGQVSRSHGAGGLQGALPVALRLQDREVRHRQEQEGGPALPAAAGLHPDLPGGGENVFFVITNLVVTPNQRQETCAESENIPDALCYEDSDCPPGEPVVAGNGVRTGRCLRSGSEQKGTCEIFAWCPVETKSRPAKPLLGKAEDFTVYIKNFIRFPKFNFSKTNVLDTTDRAFLKSCKFGPKDPYCPIFRLGSVVSWTGSSFQEIAVQGGVIGIQIEWDCDLDRAPSECYPRYYFNRLDNRFSENSPSSGYNFRFAKYYRDAAGVELRTLFKAYGIRFDVMVNGKAGKFNIIPTVINVGSGVALMGVVSTSPPPPLPSEHPRGRAGGTLPQGSCPSTPERTELGRSVWMGVKRALWDFTPLQQPPGGRDYLGFSFQSQRGFCLWLCSGGVGVLWDPAQPCLHFC
ncbi:P2X purinoceptor 5 isoform X1 [Physeter macrocephalus]|uniref:P2X purinoceptor n=1 Tax=Physeter macrocephalus TaxID=9755 RepID=A0A455CA32_PHYMC|nr:P2X purinoceptor 5 isoform X1 [Physeter catodon]|eukprot:XP_028353976.1 P2X purinoceptor 5 isoform X2 [Physeter catodon]